MDSDPILFLNYFAQIDNMFVVAIIILLLLLLASALISGTEVAFFSLSKTDIINISEETKDHNPVVELLQKPRKKQEGLPRHHQTFKEKTHKKTLNKFRALS